MYNLYKKYFVIFNSIKSILIFFILYNSYTYYYILCVIVYVFIILRKSINYNTNKTQNIQQNINRFFNS